MEENRLRRSTKRCSCPRTSTGTLETISKTALVRNHFLTQKGTARKVAARKAPTITGTRTVRLSREVNLLAVRDGQLRGKGAAMALKSKMMQRGVQVHSQPTTCRRPSKIKIFPRIPLSKSLKMSLMKVRKASNAITPNKA